MPVPEGARDLFSVRHTAAATLIDLGRNVVAPIRAWLVAAAITAYI